MPSGRVPKNILPVTNDSLFISMLPFNAFIGLFHSVFISSMSIKSAQRFCLLLALCFQYLPSSLWGYLLCLFKTLIPLIHSFCFPWYRFFSLLPFFYYSCPPQTSCCFFSQAHVSLSPPTTAVRERLVLLSESNMPLASPSQTTRSFSKSSGPPPQTLFFFRGYPHSGCPVSASVLLTPLLWAGTKLALGQCCFLATRGNKVGAAIFPEQCKREGWPGLTLFLVSGLLL